MRQTVLLSRLLSLDEMVLIPTVDFKAVTSNNPKREAIYGTSDEHNIMVTGMPVCPLDHSNYMTTSYHLQERYCQQPPLQLLQQDTTFL